MATISLTVSNKIKKMATKRVIKRATKLKRGEKITFSIGKRLNGKKYYVLLAYRHRFGRVKSRVLGEFGSDEAMNKFEKKILNS